MPVLCFDTASDTLVACLLGDGDGAPLLAAASEPGQRAQGVLEVAERLLADAGTRVEDLTAVCVGLGPGAFTGLRVGVATARGIAATLGVPVVGFDSLVAVGAQLALEHPGQRVWAELDARRGERFMRQVVATDGARVEPSGAMRAVPVDDAPDLVAAGDHVARGPATPTSLAHAARAALVAAAATAAEPDGASEGDPFPVPSYGREPDAEPRRVRITVDELTVADIDELVELERLCFENPWSRSSYLHELVRPPQEAVLLAARDADRGGRLVGAALTARIGDSWHVMNVLVDPVARRMGIARSLVERTLELTVDDPCDGWTLEVRAGNAAAIALYDALGFRREGLRRAYYPDGEDALVMWRRAAT